MAKYLVRKNCEYSIEVEADSSELALANTDIIPLAEWQQAWSESETEGAAA